VLLKKNETNDVLSQNNSKIGDFVDRIHLANCLLNLKNMSTKRIKYDVNQNPQHFDDISFRKKIGRIRVIFITK
jgi:hypothetical protein